MSSEPAVVLTVPSSIMVRQLICLLYTAIYFCICMHLLFLHVFRQNKRGKVEESQRKVGVVLLNGQKLDLCCDVKAVCKDVLDMVIAHIGLVEQHLFSLAYLKG